MYLFYLEFYAPQSSSYLQFCSRTHTKPLHTDTLRNRCWVDQRVAVSNMAIRAGEQQKLRIKHLLSREALGAEAMVSIRHGVCKCMCACSERGLIQWNLLKGIHA